MYEDKTAYKKPPPVIEFSEVTNAAERIAQEKRENPARYRERVYENEQFTEFN